MAFEKIPDKRKDMVFSEISKDEHEYIKKYFQPISKERNAEKKDGLGRVETYVSTYSDEYLDLYLSKAPEKTTPIFVVEVSEYGRSIKLCFHSAVFDENDNAIRQEMSKQPRKILERIMRHYPPHTNIYEREMVGNSARDLDLKLKKKNEPESVKKKVSKV